MSNCTELHGGMHCKPLNCTECGRFSSDSWDTGEIYTQNGFNQHWGGVCEAHGEWSESAA